MTLLVRGGSLVDTMSDYLIREIDNADNVDVRLHTEIEDVRGDLRLDGLVLRDRSSGRRRRSRPMPRSSSSGGPAHVVAAA